MLAIALELAEVKSSTYEDIARSVARKKIAHPRVFFGGGEGEVQRICIRVAKEAESVDTNLLGSCYWCVFELGPLQQVF